MIDKKNLILIVVVLAIAGIIGFWVPYTRSKQVLNSPVPVDSSGQAEKIVEYNEKGFAPNILTVSVGTTVAWANRSGRPMWVGSDPHPAHTDLPGFDQKRIINKIFPEIVKKAYAHGDAIYKFTFEKVGEWKYHNHVNPVHRGTVIVVEK